MMKQADEASHRGVNHTLGNLDQTGDPNPFIDGRLDTSHMKAQLRSPVAWKGGEVLKR